MTRQLVASGRTRKGADGHGVLEFMYGTSNPDWKPKPFVYSKRFPKPQDHDLIRKQRLEGDHDE